MLLNVANIRLVCEEHLHASLLKNGFAVLSRIGLGFPETASLQLPALPEGLSVHPINNFKLLSQCTWYAKVLGWHETAESFFNAGFGFVLTNNEGVIVAESYGAFIGKELCEIGIVSHPDHQGKGYATIAACYAIVECQKRGIKPVWSCDSNNIGSLMVALKLGFQIKSHYAFLIKAQPK